jgi:catechol 2,3-dioxygenase-like lactoylglutathione lyase family enzyme
MIDHVYISVTNIDKSLAFYLEALKPLGWSKFGKYDSASGHNSVPDLHGIGDDVYTGRKGVGSSIWLRQRKSEETGLYLGIVCDTNELVDAAFAAAFKAGGIDEGKPADRNYFAPGITRPTSRTSTTIESSSSTRRGTLSGVHSNLLTEFGLSSLPQEHENGTGLTESQRLSWLGRGMERKPQ